MWLYHRNMSPKDADGMANSVDPDQTPLIWVYTVWPGLSVRKLRINTVSLLIALNHLELTQHHKFSKFYTSLNLHMQFTKTGIRATTRQNMSSGVSDQATHKPVCAATEASWSLEISAIESRDIILSKQRTTKALIRLRGCAGWSAPLLFAYIIRHIFSWPGSYVLNWLVVTGCSELQQIRTGKTS